MRHPPLHSARGGFRLRSVQFTVKAKGSREGAFSVKTWVFCLADENLLSSAKVCTVYADNVNALRNFRKLDCVRSGRKVTGINAGSIFTCVKNVADEDFSYDSMRALLTNSFVPWKHENLNEELVREGANRKCIINYEKNGRPVDVWAESLKYVKNIQVSEWYSVIRKWVKSLSEAKDFKTLRQAWFTGRNQLFDFESLPEDSECNLVLGHCLDQLEELVNLEEKYKVSVSRPFAFFVNELDNAVYQPQNKTVGVNIFKYEVSATASFKYQFVVDINC